MKLYCIAFIALTCFGTAAIAAETNLEVAWRICEKHATIIGTPVMQGPARMVWRAPYGGCEEIQKLVPTMRTEILDPTQSITDLMLIEKALHDPNGPP